MTQELDLNGIPPRVADALIELRDMILARYPTATFHVSNGYDEPENWHLWTTVDLDDTDEILDLVRDRVLDLQIEERVPVYVIPLDTPERTLAELARRQEARRRRQTHPAAVGE